MYNYQVLYILLVFMFCQISPTSGPVEGGTHVEILGRNIGVQRRDIVRVVIGGEIPCDVEMYEPGRRY